LKDKLIIGGYQGSNSLHTKSIEYFINDINGNFDIDFTMDITNKGEKASSLISKTQKEELHISYLLSSYFEKILPEIKILDLPYFFNNRSQAYELLKFDFFEHISSKVRLIKSLSDCEEQIIRTTPSPLHIDIFKKLGFKPKPLDVRDFKLAIENDEIDAQENPLTNYWNFGVYKKQKFVTLTSHIFGFCLFVINYSYFDKLSDLQKEFVINKSNKVTEFQRQLAVLEDANLLKEMKLANIKVEKIDEENLIEFKNITQTFHQDYFKNFPHMQRYISTS